MLIAIARAKTMEIKSNIAIKIKHIFKLNSQPIYRAWNSFRNFKNVQMQQRVFVSPHVLK